MKHNYSHNPAIVEHTGADINNTYKHGVTHKKADRRFCMALGFRSSLEIKYHEFKGNMRETHPRIYGLLNLLKRDKK
jgi:hypothetical protein